MRELLTTFVVRDSYLDPTESTVVKIAVVILSAILVGCLVYVIRTLAKMNASSKSSAQSSMGAWEPDPTPARKAAHSPVTPQPSQAFDTPIDADLPKDGEPAAKNQMADAESAVVEEKAASSAVKADEEAAVEDHARQSTGVSDSEKIHGKTMALSSFDFDKLLAERKDKKDDDS